MRGRSRIISTLAQRVRANNAAQITALDVWRKNSLRPPAGDDSGVSLYTNFSHEATPAVSRKFSGRFPSVARMAFCPFLNFPAGAGVRKERGVSSPLPSYLPASM
ncbi:hypothetical protein EGH44_24410 [Klebsiella aerogenes]|nr:hypothetical protein EGH44_24410 [Klebsiella aerogenes]